MLWFGIGLCFSLLGDVILMLNPRFFMAGVGAFLLAHVSYLIGFNQQPAPFSMGVMVIAVFVGISASRVFRLIRPGIMRVPRGKRFLSAAFTYGATLTLMLLSALLTLFRPDWDIKAALFAASGAILFFTSDTILAYDRFVNKLKHGQSFVHLTYHLAQVGLILGAMFHFLK
jgi:alkenylglycerophosphocholine/alkenylglycerophosphoethanolamine hydrolase